jgi:hypothetical protein
MTDYMIIGVGDPYPGAIPSSPTLDVTTDGSMELLIPVDAPTPYEIDRISRGPCAFSVFAPGDQQLFFLWTYPGAFDWSDTPWNCHLETMADRQPTPETVVRGADDHQVLITSLIDTDTKIVRALRACTLSPAVSLAFWATVWRQQRHPWPGIEAYDRELARLRAHYTSHDMMHYGIARCEGGS